MYEGNLYTREGGSIEIDVFHSNFSLTVGFEELQFGQYIPVYVLFTWVVKLKVLENFSIHIFQGKCREAMYYLRSRSTCTRGIYTRGRTQEFDDFDSNFWLTVGFEELKFGKCNYAT